MNGRRQISAGPLLPAADPRRRAPREVARRPTRHRSSWPRGRLSYDSARAVDPPFRALRYSRELVEDPPKVVAPPYDVISPEEHRRLLARTLARGPARPAPRRAGDPEDERYRRAGHTLAAWRSEGVLRRDPRPALYAYEQRYVVPGTEREATRARVFARVGLEAFAPTAAVRAHERTLAEPREDRYRLLRATGVNTSPVVGLAEDRSGTAAEWLRDVAASAPVSELVDDAGVEHRLWMSTLGQDEARDTRLAAVAARLGAGAITLADGHHRYETALRYADDRRRGPALEEQPAWAEILMLILERRGPLTVLRPTRAPGARRRGRGRLVDRAEELFEVERGVSREALVSAFDGSGDGGGGEGGSGFGPRRGAICGRADPPSCVSACGRHGACGLDVTSRPSRSSDWRGSTPPLSRGRLALRCPPQRRSAGSPEAAAPPGGQPARPACSGPDARRGDRRRRGGRRRDAAEEQYIYPKALTGLVIPLE